MIPRKIEFYRNFFLDFYKEQKSEVQLKIKYVLEYVTTEEILKPKFFKHLEGTDGLYEIRVKQGSNIYRIFCCFDKGNIVVLFNGFTKKTEKTPKEEILRAEKIKAEYFEKQRKI